MQANSAYAEFLERKIHRGADSGFEPTFMPDAAFDFQKALIEWSVRKGRAAMFADCGLGKTLCELAWAENVRRHTGKPVLILTPLAVAPQTVAEGEKFGIECARSKDGKVSAGITVTNYERLHLFEPSDFSAVVCDESSILKSFDGARRTEITAFMRKQPYRLLATATAAPNDYIELCTSSEALGYLGRMDVLNKFFVNDQNSSALRRNYGEAPKWRFRGHAELPFWRWVTSWARACRKPSDLGFEDGAFILPPLVERRHVLTPSAPPEGMLFTLAAHDLRDQREERKRTLHERCEKAAALADHDQPALLWCQGNDEGDLLERLIPGCVQVAGKDSDDAKEERLLAFSRGEARVLVTKPKIGAWGLNFQHCNHIGYFPSHSYEQFYQAVRRCWRFGQRRAVTVDLVLSEGECRVMDNLQRKADAAERMFSNLVAEMNNAMAMKPKIRTTREMEIPSWLLPIR